MRAPIIRTLRKYKRPITLLKGLSSVAFSFIIIAGIVMMSLGFSALANERATADSSQQKWYASPTGRADSQYHANLIPASPIISIPDGSQRIFVYDSNEQLMFSEGHGWDVQITLASAMIAGQQINYSLGWYDSSADTQIFEYDSDGEGTSIVTSDTETVYTVDFTTSAFTVDPGDALFLVLSPSGDDMDLQLGLGDTWFQANGRDHPWYCSMDPMQEQPTYQMYQGDDLKTASTLAIAPYEWVIWASDVAATGEGGVTYTGNWSLQLTLDEALPAEGEIGFLFGYTDEFNLFNGDYPDNLVLIDTVADQTTYSSDTINPGEFTVPEDCFLAIALLNFCETTMELQTGGTNSWAQHPATSGTTWYASADEVPPVLYLAYTSAVLSIPDGDSYLFAYGVTQETVFTTDNWSVQITLDEAVAADDTINYGLYLFEIGIGGYAPQLLAEGSFTTEESKKVYQDSKSVDGFTAYANDLLALIIQPVGVSIDMLLTAGTSSTLFVSPAGDIWLCTANPLHRGVKYEMFKEDDEQSAGTITITRDSEPVIWIADEAALVDCTFPAGDWALQLTLNAAPADGTGCWVQIGYVNDSLWFNGINESYYIALDDAFTVYTPTISVGSFTVPGPNGEDYYLAVLLEYDSGGNDVDIVIKVGGSDTWLQSPTGDPGYPVPEAAAYILIGAGMICLGGYYGYRKYRNRAAVNN